MTAAVPASMAATNGTSSRAASVDMSTFSTGSARWLSSAVSPWPGKCLAHAATPADCSPRVHAATWAATAVGADGPEASGADHRVVGVGVDVRDRAEVEGDADRGELEADRPPDRPGQREVVGRAEGQRPEHRAAVGHVQPGDVAALLVDRDHGAGRDGAHARRCTPRPRPGRRRCWSRTGRARPAPPRAARARRPAPSSRRTTAAAPAGPSDSRLDGGVIPSPPRRSAPRPSGPGRGGRRRSPAPRSASSRPSRRPSRCRG